MKKNLYFRQTLMRVNVLRTIILAYFLAFASYPRLLLEVFIRKNFGERYFSFASALTVFVILFLIPIASQTMSMTFGKFDAGKFFLHYGSWYAFLVLFLIVSKRRNKEIKRNPSVFDFAKFSLYAGDINPKFFRFKMKNRTTDYRLVEIFAEPLLFFAIGIVLMILQQRLGVLVVGCSVFYSLGYAGAYMNGDHYVMNIIDEMIINEEMEDAFVNEKDPSETRGFRFYGRKPNDTDLRRKVVEQMTEEEGVYEAR